MNIRNMFLSDIERPINGVIKVAQADEISLKQELSEYIITTELRKHFDTFFDNYSKSIDTPTNNVGVWISGFYGSGKSHFLKMLSYLLANQVVADKKPIEYFEDKFEDPMMYSTVKRCTDIPTETILFNIDIEGGAYKDKTAILKVFAKVFYNHLGYYGDDLKIVKLERFIEKQGKSDEFRKVFKEVNGDEWENARDSFGFFEDDIVDVLVKVLGMSETAARNWFNGEETAEISIKQLADDINDYVQNKEKNFRLLFMVDEVGQYINSDVDLKINLQSIVEQLGSVCKGKAWVVVTSQEAIDSFTKHNEMDFSGIMGRFNTKLSLTSSSADEVIKKRILRKTDTATELLTLNYHSDYAVLKNLFTFSSDCIMDLKGYRDEFDYVATYPFVPYQFTVIQKVFDAIRNYGIASKHQSSGERSLLECYQIAAQKVKDKDEKALVPFYYFYDTVSNALDTTIRRVIDRCDRAARNGDGIEEQDVSVLKLLYLLRYIDDIPSNIDNLANLMVDDVRADKINLREEVKLSLDRLIRSNYVARNGDKYNFLTDEEQDIARDIRATDVGAPDIRASIASTIFNDIYPTQKFKYGKYDFDFDKYVDDAASGITKGGMRLRIVTVAGDLYGVSEQKLILDSHINQEAIIILSDETPYFDEIEQAKKIDKYVKQRNVSQLSDSVQEIVRKHQSEARNLNNRAKSYIEKAILEAKIYVHGEKLEVKYASAKDILNAALNNLVESVYSKLNMITTFSESDADVMKILNEPIADISTMVGMGANNEEAINELSQWLELQNQKGMPVSMGDVQKRYGEIPYGFREIDIASVVAKLIVQQKIEIRYGGSVVDKSNRRLVDYLRKKSEIDKASVIRHVPVDEALIRKTTAFLRDYIGAMGIPSDEASLIDFVITTFEEKQTYYNGLLKQYDAGRYPQKEIVIEARDLMSDVLSQRKDNVALLNRIVSKQDELLDMAEDTEEIETFFRTQKDVFDKATNKAKLYQSQNDYFVTETDTMETLSELKAILYLAKPYSRIKELPELMQKLEVAYGKLLELKKEEVRNIIVQCMGDIHTLAGSDLKVKDQITKSDNHLMAKKNEANEAESLIILDAMITQLLNYKDTVCRHIELLLTPVAPKAPTTSSDGAGVPPKAIKSVSIRRYDLCPARRLQSKEDIDKYVELVRAKLYDTLEDNDSVQIN